MTWVACTGSARWMIRRRSLLFSSGGSGGPGVAGGCGGAVRGEWGRVPARHRADGPGPLPDFDLLRALAHGGGHLGCRARPGDPAELEARAGGRFPLSGPVLAPPVRTPVGDGRPRFVVGDRVRVREWHPAGTPVALGTCGARPGRWSGWTAPSCPMSRPTARYGATNRPIRCGSTRRSYGATASAAHWCTSICGTATWSRHERQPHQPDPLSPIERRVAALEAVLTERGLLPEGFIDEITRRYESEMGPMNGAKVVARAWVDPGYRSGCWPTAPPRSPSSASAVPRATTWWSWRTPPRAQRDRVHAVLVLPVAGARAAARLVQGPAVPGPDGTRAAGPAGRDGLPAARRDGDPGVGLLRRGPLPRPARAAAGHGGRPRTSWPPW